MTEVSVEAIRASASLIWLVLLLSWESFAPFFNFFVHATADRVRHGVRNLVLGVVNALVNATICVGLWWAVARWTEAQSFGVLHWLSLPDWARLIGAFLLIDVWMYSWHRLNHQVPFLWRFHRVHHSDPKMDVTTANRFHAGEIVMSCVLRIPVIALAGVRLEELAIYEAVMFGVVQLHHANIHLTEPVDRLLRLLIVTPYMHKVHHSNWQPETDSNYASLLSVWDRLFGSFRMRDDPHALVFGLRELSAPGNLTLPGLIATPFKSTPRNKVATPET